jgi:hypothetical protein
MHSLDTVKTRQQGDPSFPPKYTSMTSSYATIYRQEGFFRGLYGGVTPALLGSFPGTVIFFGTYEFTKRWMLDAGINPNVAYLSGGMWEMIPWRVGACNHIDIIVLFARVYCGLGRFCRICSLGGVEDAAATPGAL